MKRLLAILLTLVLCLGVFVSCDNNEETSSSEELQEASEQSSSSEIVENEPYNCLVSFESKKLYNYYKKLDSFEYIGEDFPEVWQEGASTIDFRIVETYDEFSTCVSDPDGLEPSFFEESFILVVYNCYNDFFPPKNCMGYRNFYIEDNVAYIYEDMISYRREVEIIDGGMDVDISYYAIPKESLSALDVERVNVTMKRFNIYSSSQYYIDRNVELENGSSFVISNEEERTNFSSEYGIETNSVDFSKYLYIAIYRTDIGAHEKQYGYSVGEEEEKFILNSYSVINEDVYTFETGARFDLVKIPKSWLSFEHLNQSKVSIIANKSYVN